MVRKKFVNIDRDGNRSDYVFASPCFDDFIILILGTMQQVKLLFPFCGRRSRQKQHNLFCPQLLSDSPTLHTPLSLRSSG